MFYRTVDICTSHGQHWEAPTSFELSENRKHGHKYITCMVAQGFGFKVDIKFIGVQVDHGCHGSLGYLVVPWLQKYSLVAGHGCIVLCIGLFDKPMHCDTGFHSHVRQFPCDILFYTPMIT